MPDLVVAYDPTWPERYDSEAERLRETLGAIAVEIEHVGSTAVPGIAAKPTIDIAVGVRRLQDIGTAQIAAMEGLDYVYGGEAGVPGRHYFKKGSIYPRAFHVSIVEWRGPLWRDYLLFRSYLRTHADEATAYVEAKRAAMKAADGRDPISYWEHKHPFVEAMLERARGESEAEA